MSVESYFSGKHNLKKIISQRLDKAEKSILVAVAWLTDRQLFSKLVQKQGQGVSVELIITKHEINDNSLINYRLIEENGGVFIEAGDENGIMHNKFCIIDFQTVINGSFNWTGKANTSNQENITVVDGDTRMISDFVDEFERLKQLNGYSQQILEEIESGKIIKYFNLFKAFISINEPEKISPYLYEIKNVTKIKHIVEYLYASDYSKAIVEIENFIRLNSQIVNISAQEKEFLLSQIKIITHLIELKEIEKTEIEAILEQFNHRYRIELNPLIAKILELKKKIYQKLERDGIINEEFKNAESEFNRINEEYEYESKISIPVLNDDDTKSIKEMYREAVKYCHPDSLECIFEDKMKASEVFSALTTAYKLNNIEKVQSILNDLKFGKSITDLNDDIEYLRARLSGLKIKLTSLTNEIMELKCSKSYGIIAKVNDWNEYFDSQKNLLDQEFQVLSEKYCKQ